MRDRRQFRDLVEPVNRSHFGCLRQRQRGGLDMMHKSRKQMAERIMQRLGGHLAHRPLDGEQLRPRREHFRRAAFIDIEMRMRMTEHRAMGRREGRQRQRVRRRSRHHRKDGDLMLENLRETVRQPLRDLVVAIGGCRPLIGARNGRHDFRRDTGCVVAGEIHSAPRPPQEARP